MASSSLIFNSPPADRAPKRRPCGVTFGRENGLAEAFGGFVGEDLAVADVDHAMGVFGDIRLVGDKDDGVPVGMQ